jgi:hypothetical protein
MRLEDSKGGGVMSYRLIDSNALAMSCAEVNDLPCIYADLPNGPDGEHYTMTADGKECELMYGEDDDGVDGWYTHCGGWFAATRKDSRLVRPLFCQLCGKKAWTL